jgi:dUTP pyrophosphatase
MTIKIFEQTPGCMPQIIKQGDWIDLRLAETVTLKAPQANKLHVRNKGDKQKPEVRVRDVDFDSTLASLGVCIQIPEGFESIIVPRSSTFRKYGILQTNSIGVIDQSYCSNEDVWKMPLVATQNITIPKFTRIAQFRIQPSQKASVWQKLKWLFSSGIKIKHVTTLKNPERGGFGSTGEN